MARWTLNEDRGPWPPVIAEGGQRRHQGGDRSTKTGGHGPRLSARRRAVRPDLQRSTKTGGHGPRLLAAAQTADSTAIDRSTKTGGHGPRLFAAVIRLNSPAAGRSTKTGGHGPRLSGCLVPGRAALAARSTKTGGHGPRLWTLGDGTTVALFDAQRRPGAMAPGYLGAVTGDQLDDLAQRRPGAMAPGYRVTADTAMGAPGAQRRPGAMAPGYHLRPAHREDGANRSTKTGGHGPRLSEK